MPAIVAIVHLAIPAPAHLILSPHIPALVALVIIVIATLANKPIASFHAMRVPCINFLIAIIAYPHSIVIATLAPYFPVKNFFIRFCYFRAALSALLFFFFGHRKLFFNFYLGCRGSTSRAYFKDLL
jgi:hypothetical protein